MLVVSVHDVAPSTLDEVRWLCDRLDEAGVPRRVLKVIPVEDGRELDPTSPTADFLRSERDRGSEIVLHGYTHRSEGAFRGSGLDNLRARTFAPRDAEFLSIDAAEARRRLRAGRAVLQVCGLVALGFCAPGWLAAPWLEAELGADGFVYAIGLVRIAQLTRGRYRSVPAFGYMGADAVQERLVGMGGDVSIALHRHMRGRFPHLRAFLHPRRGRESEACQRALDWIRRFAQEEPAGTYADLLDDA